MLQVHFISQLYVSEVGARWIFENVKNLLGEETNILFFFAITFPYCRLSSPNFACRVGLKYYSLNKKEWICSLFKEWILEKNEIRVNLEWIWSEHLCHFGVTTCGITQGFRVIPVVTPKWVNNTNVHYKFTLISLFSKIHSLKSEHIHSFFV